MNENRDKVIAWIRSGNDYNVGISLLAEISRKKGITEPFIGKQRTMAGKLVFENLKAVSLADHTNWKEVIKDILSGNTPLVYVSPAFSPFYSSKPVQVSPIAETIETIETSETKAAKPLAEYPSLIRRIINEYAELFQERSKLHTTMAEMPESNADSVCVKRAEIFNIIKSISERLEKLYLGKTEFEKTGILPDASQLYPEKPEKMEVTDDSLKKMKKNLQTGNSKDKTILDYQAKESAAFKNPMPKGPKRIKIEMRIQERNKRIEEIEMQLLHPDQDNAGKE